MPRAMSATTRAKVKATLEVFVENVVSKYRDRQPPRPATPSEYLGKLSTEGELKPFHSAIIPPEIMRVSQFERGFSTSLGSTFEEVARLIALDHHADAKRNYAISEEVPGAAISEIERLVSQFESAAQERGARPELEAMIKAVLDVQAPPSEKRTSRADLFVRRKDGVELYFEMKSPQPNKGQCLEVTQRILRTHLIRRTPRPKVQAYFAMAYNPYGQDRSDYKWSFALSHMPFDKAVLIGHEFWTVIGGPSTYVEVLEVYQEVGVEKGKYMIDALAFGF